MTHEHEFVPLFAEPPRDSPLWVTWLLKQRGWRDVFTCAKCGGLWYRGWGGRMRDQSREPHAPQYLADAVDWNSRSAA